MADFNSKISTIRQDLDALLGTIRSVETELHGASASFAELAANAKDISTLSTAIQRLSRFLDSNKSPFLDEIKGRVKDINAELSKLNVRQLETATTALEANAKAMAAISRAQANTNRNLEAAKATIAGVRSELSLLEAGSKTAGGGLEASVARIQASLEKINGLQNISGVIGGLNQLDPTKYNQAADSLDRVLKTVQALKSANISIDVSAATEGQKLTKRPIQPVVQAPTVELPASTTAANQRAPKASARTVQFAQENNIDLAQVTGTGSHNTITKQDLLNFRNANKPVGDVSINVSQLLQQAQKKQESLAKLDAALDRITEAKQRAFEAAVKEHGLRTSNQVDIARKYLLPESNLAAGELYNRKLDFSQIRKNKESDDLETTFARQLRNQGEVETGLPQQFEKIKITDDKAINDLLAVRDEINKEVQRLAKAITNAPQATIGDVKARVAAAVAAKRTAETGNSIDYLLNKAAGKEDVFTGGTGFVDESLIHHDPKSDTYSTRGNKIKGANDSEFEANRAVITRAVENSPTGIAVISSTGANFGGASAITGAGGSDHIAVAFKDIETGLIRIREKLTIDPNPSKGNVRGAYGFGNAQAPERSLDEFAQGSDRIDAIALHTGQETAQKFLGEFLKETDPEIAKPYSAVKEAGTRIGEAGDTCASAFRKVSESVGLLDVQAKFEKTPLIGGAVGNKLNITTPEDVVRSVQEHNRAQIRQAVGETQTPLQQQAAGTNSFLELLGTKLTSIFTRASEALRNAFTNVKNAVGDTSIGDIFAYIKSLFTAEPKLAAHDTTAPQFTIGGAAGIRSSLADFSKNIYRPVSYGASQFGALLNAGQEIARGVQTGGPGGALDIAGGAIKGAHTLANANAYYGLNLLPKGVGELFNNRRSDTILDIYEAVVGAKTGYKRGSVDRNFEALKQQEAPLAARKDALKEVLDNGGLDEASASKARIAYEQVTEELRQLRQSISAYRRVIAEEAKKSGEVTSTQSTGKTLEQQAHAAAVQPTINSFLSENEKALSVKAAESLQRFSAGTGFSQGVSGGLNVASPDTFDKALRSRYTEEQFGAINPKAINGLAIPEVDELGKRIATSVAINIRGLSENNYASTAVHEATHGLVEGHGGLYGPGGFTNEATAALAHQATAPLADNLELIKSITDKTARNVLTNASDDVSLRTGHYNQPGEQYAYTGQALLSDNKQLQAVLKHIYGQDLYDSLVKDLETSIPDTFGAEALPILQKRFQTFEREFNSIISGRNENELQPTVGSAQAKSVVQQKSDELSEAIKDALNKVFGGNVTQAKGLASRFGSLLPGIEQSLEKALTPGSASFSNIVDTSIQTYLPQNTPKRALFETLKNQGSGVLTSLNTAIQDPNKQNIANVLTQAKGLDVTQILREYGKRVFTGEGGLDVKNALIVKGLANTQTPGDFVQSFATQLGAGKQANFRDELNDIVQKQTGRNIQLGSFQQQSAFDTEGVQRFTLSAKTADGALVQLNAHVDEFGRKKIDEPEKAMTRFASSLHEITVGALRQIGDQFTYSIVGGIQEMFQRLLSVQDELGEVANLFGKVGDAATKVKADFLYSSVNTAVKTGQGFDEALQSNIKNFKTLGAIKDPGTRSELSNQISQVQLGAQTAFGLPLEQSLEAIPAILASIKNGMDDITDPAEKTTAAVKELRNVMNEVVTATRVTGADGNELITVYSRLAESAKEYGLNSKQLLGIAATSSVAIGRGPEETTNILKSLLEGSYLESNQGKFAQSRIATKEFNPDTNTIENRGFDKILKDLYQLSQDPTKNVEYSQLVQGIVGKKIAPDAQKIISAVGRNYDQSQVALGQTQPGTFENLVGQKSQTITGSLNKLNATGTQLLGSLLVGTGGFDAAAKFFDNLSESAVKLTGFLNQNEGAIKSIVNALAPFIKFFAVGFATKDVNIFAPLAKGISAVEKTIEGAKAKFVDVGKIGEGAPTGLERSLKIINALLEEMRGEAEKTGAALEAALSQGNAAATTTATTLQPTIGAVSPEKELENNAKVTNVLTKTQGIVENFANPQTSVFTRAKEAIRPVGAAAGALAAPVAFDVITGGLGKDNLTNVGAGIAGGIAGAFAGGPYGAIIGYSIAKSISEKIDLSSAFGTSEKEASTFAEQLAEKIFNKKPPQEENAPTEAQTKVATGQLQDIQKKLGLDALQQSVSGAILGPAYTNTTSDEVKDYLDRQRTGRKSGLVEGFFQNDARTSQAVSAFGGNKQLLDLFAGSGLGSISEFLQQLQDPASETAQAFAKLSVQTQQQALASANVIEADNKRAQQQSAQDAIDAGKARQSDLEAKLQSDYQTPYGLDKYNAFSPLAQGLTKSFAPEISGITKGTLAGPDAQAVLDRLARSQESLANLPQTLQQLVPLAQSLGLNTGGLEQRLYNVGAQGQGQVLQRFQPAIEADRNVQLYELQQSRLRGLQGSDSFKAKDQATLAEVAALQKALATDKARYDINKAFLELLKGQSGALLDQTEQVEQQNKTRQLISAGTPSQFTPASIFDTKGTSSTQLNQAIEFALNKQRKLEALNPEYRKEFAKDQFLLQSGSDFKGVTGVNQGFVQEFLQQQQQQKEAPLQDLSQYSDQQISKILDQARGLQGQAEKLDPSRVGKYDNERLLILKKNNELLAQTGVGQEFLKAAIDANTKSNDTLRGHYNLPSNYKAPTIFDYYDSGGKERGDKNFPTALGQGLVPLSFAQQLADQLIKGGGGDKGANLADVKDTSQPGSRPLFYPTPGTGAVYSEVEPQILPDTIKTDKSISDAVQKFLDFKQKQIDDLEDATIKGKPEANVEDTRLRRENEANGIPTGINPATGGKYAPNTVLPSNFDTSASSRNGTNLTLRELAGPGQSVTAPNGTSGGPDERRSAAATEAVSKFATTTDRTKDDLVAFSTGAQKAGTAINTVATTLPLAGVGAASLATSAVAFNGAVTALVAKIATFDLAQAIRNANVQIIFNGQVVPTNSVQITSTAAGTNALAVGTAAKTGSKSGDNRQ